MLRRKCNQNPSFKWQKPRVKSSLVNWPGDGRVFSHSLRVFDVISLHQDPIVKELPPPSPSWHVRFMLFWHQQTSSINDGRPWQPSLGAMMVKSSQICLQTAQCSKTRAEEYASTVLMSFLFFPSFPVTSQILTTACGLSLWCKDNELNGYFVT